MFDRPKRKRVSRLRSLRPRASLMVTPLPRCAFCFWPHPEACKPPSYTGRCPNCGKPSREGRTQYVAGELNLRGFWGGVAKMLYAAADLLNAWIERL